MSDAIKFQMVTNQIGRITLNQPSKRNALTAQMWADLSAALESATTDPDLRVLVVTGEGEHFAAGADISEFETLYATPETSETISHSIADALNALAAFPKPTIAKIRGACVGGGVNVPLGFVSLSENLAMMGMGVWMIIKAMGVA
jgi:enoyl-CoA hydratase/carnithine racemase